jgi:hypothetical protein
MAEPIDIDLGAVRFDAQPATLLRTAGMSARVFRYATGIEALTITAPAGAVTFLPFKGQQVWDAAFHGRRLTMRSLFEEPQDTADYLGTYGAFLIHCGITAMGGRGPSDTHPLHGELPNARFQIVRLIAGSDEDGPYLALAGEFRHARAFGFSYRFRCEAKMRPAATHLEVAVSVENLRAVPLDVMYLAHINFAPVPGARLIDTAAGDGGVTVRQEHPAGLRISEMQRRFVAELTANPALHRTIAPGQRIDPEIVLFLACHADREGWTHGVQLLPDGQADFISYRPAELPVAVRWISRLGDQEALGLILPATSGVDGYTAEKAKGRVVTLQGGGAFSCRYRCGALDATAAGALVRHIETIGRDAGKAP